MKFAEEHYIDFNQLPTNVICIKVDYAEATGTHNTQNANFVERLYNEKTPAQLDDPKCRSTIYGKPILLFHQEDSTSDPVFYGKSNMNYDKGSEYVFGFTDKYDVECWEFKNNTSDACNFLGPVPEIWVDDFEARYPEESTEIGRFREMHNWVVSTKDNLEKFKMEFENYFDMHFSLIYYVYTFFALMVDQRAKNMFLTYWGETDKFYPYFYDNDTCFGINNEGQLVLDYFHEDTDLLAGANVYNGQNSVLWCNFRDAFPDEIKECYQDLRSNSVLNYDELIDQFITKGSDKWSESIYNEDADFKYISMLYTDGDASNLGQVRGTGEEHFRYFIENRLNYCDGKWYASDYADDYVALRIYTPSTWAGVEPNADITVTPYSHMYAGVRYKANGTLYQKRVAANEVTTFEAPNETFNDTETAIYGASQLSSLGDLSPLYCGSINVSKAEKLTELIIGSDAEGYSNPNLNDLSVGTNNLLKVLNVRNCSSLTDPLALSGCPNIEEIYAAGSGITGIELANSGYLKTIELPATITNLSLKNQLYIETLTLEGYEAIKTINIENCPTIDGLDILSKATNVERVRLTNVNWSYDTAADVLALADRNLAGIDENGANIDYMWIDGKCHIKSLTGAEYLEVKEAFPYMTITYDTLTAQLIFMSEDGNTELTRQTIQNGGNGTDPVTAGTITRPTKESTAQYHFTYAGWSLTSGGVADTDALKNVEADRRVYVAFSKELRSYTVKFYNGTTLLQTSTVQYGGDAVYSGSTPVNNSSGNPDDFEFYGWSPAPTNIQGDTSCYAQFHDLREITDSWETIAAAVADGTATSKYSIGAFKTLEIGAVELPYDFNYGKAVVYDGEIHIIGGITAYRKHYKYNETDGWVEVSSLPRSCDSGFNVVVYNEAIHVLGRGANNTSGQAHHKWTESDGWVSVSTLPYALGGGGVVVFEGDIHILGGEYSRTSHYKYNETDGWVEVSALPYELVGKSCMATVYNDEIHIIGGSDSSRSHYKWNATNGWVSVSTLPYDFNTHETCVYGGDIHILGGYNGGIKHCVFNGSTWTDLDDLKVGVSNASSVIYNNQIHVLGGAGVLRRHQCFDGSKWTSFGLTESIPMQIVAHNHDELADGVGKWEPSTPIPYGFYQGSAVMLNGEVHILGTNYSSKYQTYHYKYDGSTWTSVSTIPYPFYYGSAVVYNDEIHILGGSDNDTKHYKWNATDGWVSVSTLPYNFYRATAIVFNNEIHIMGSAHTSYRLVHYKWDGSAWTSVGEPPYGVQDTCAVVLNNELHILGSFMSGKDTCHYKYDGSAWTEVSTLPYAFYNGSAVVFNNQIHILGGYGGSEPYTQHYKWTGTEWVEDTTLPYDFYRSCALVYNNKITLLGSGLNKYGKHFYQLSGPDWENVETLPFEFTHGRAVVKDNAIYAVTAKSYSIYKDNVWTTTTLNFSDLTDTTGMVIEYNNEFYLLPVVATTSSIIYKFDGTTWVDSGIKPPCDSNNYNAIEYDGCLHWFGGFGNNSTAHYKYDGETWTSIATLAGGVYYNSVIVYDGKIYGFNYMINKLFTFDGTKWTDAGSVPLQYQTLPSTCICVHNDELYIISPSNKAIYKYTVNGWVIVRKWISGYQHIGNAKLISFRHKLHVLGGHNHKIHYQISNPRATLTFLAGNLLKDDRTLFGRNTNAGGWEVSDLRAWLNGEFIGTLQSDLQVAIKDVVKLSDKGCTDFPTMVSTKDKCWIPSIDEVDGTIKVQQYVKGAGQPYSVFTDNNSRIRLKTDGSKSTYHLRTATEASNLSLFVGTAGEVGGASLYNIRSVLPGFCI